jgi:hypothetical protein
VSSVVADKEAHVAIGTVAASAELCAARPLVLRAVLGIAAHVASSGMAYGPRPRIVLYCIGPMNMPSAQVWLLPLFDFMYWLLLV